PRFSPSLPSGFLATRASNLPRSARPGSGGTGLDCSQRMSTKLRRAYGWMAFGVAGFALGCNTGAVGGSGGGGGGPSGPGSSGTEATSSGQGGIDFTTTGTGTSTGSMACDPNMLDLTGCTCSPGVAARDCYVGNPAQAGVGVCNMGKQDCMPVNMKE